MSTPTGPCVVAVGGGHGLAVTLAAARRYAASVTALVSVADDGGSSGRLRASLKIPAPGDLRRCLAALGDGGPLARALEYRFDAGDVAGHALGNLLIAGLAAELGDLTAALDELARLVGARGRVLPVTDHPVELRADTTNGSVRGQVAVQETPGIRRVALEPVGAPASRAALEAIAALTAADQIVLGPGSLYTSVLAAAIVPEIRDAIAASPATTVYVCNLRPQPNETEGYDAADHVRALVDHGITPDVVVRDPAALEGGAVGVRCVERRVARDDATQHDPCRLALVLRELCG